MKEINKDPGDYWSDERLVAKKQDSLDQCLFLSVSILKHAHMHSDDTAKPLDKKLVISIFKKKEIFKLLMFKELKQN